MENFYDTIHGWGNNTIYSCTSINKTSLITNAYNGIPETLMLNVLAWILLIILFSMLRHQVGDYGRLALVNDKDNRKPWTEIFYSRGNSYNEEPHTSGSINSQVLRQASSSSYSSKSEIFNSGRMTSKTSSDSSNHMQQIDVTPLPSDILHDEGLLSWIIITLKLRKEQILMHTGPDAVYYLSFQKHLMVVMAIVTLVSLVIILPVNFYNGLPNMEYDKNSFARTTMANLSPESAWLWVHVIVAIIYVPVIVLIMRRSSGRNAFKKAATRTIMITNISCNDRNTTVIRNYVQNLVPDITIEDVQIAYNISELYGRNAEYERILDARIYCQHHCNRESLTLRPNFCSCKRENAFEYYQREERALHGDIARLKAAALNDPLDIAFLTLSTVQEAQNIFNLLLSKKNCQWNLSFAPSPDDLFWENLNVSRGHWLLKWTTVNTALFLILFFLTTPAIIVNLWDSIPKEEFNQISPLVSEFLPTLMLWTLSVLMPVIVTFSDKWMNHYTRSKKNYSIMTKCFAYLLFMILILPSLGLTSAQAFFEWSISTDTMRWQCIFLPDRGSFYVNYVITAAFIGTVMELLRFPELIVYLWMLLTAKSKAETPYIQRYILIEFPFGSHYAWTTLVSTISIVYSVFCPLIMPFAMVYICLKHFVDRYNLYFAYGPSNMLSRNGGKIHSTAVTMTKFSVILLLLIMAMISAIRGSGMARAMVLIFSLVITLTLFTFMSPIKRCTNARRPSIVEIAGPVPIYIPVELKQRPTSGIINSQHYVHHHSPSPINLNGNISTSTVYGGYGPESVSDFDIISENSTNADV